MKLSIWEIIFTTLIFIAFICITIINTYAMQKIIKSKKTMKKNSFWTIFALVTLSQILIVPTAALKILSFTFYLNSYQMEVTFANWITFVAVALTILTIVFLPRLK